MVDKAAWRELLRKHQRRYPEMRVADAYKLVHQVLNGTEHTMSDLDEARELLLDELANLTQPAVPLDEPLVEMISPRGLEIAVLRAHLRPFQARGLDPEKLLTAMVETSLLLPVRDAEPIDAVWSALASVLVDDLKFAPEEVEALTREVALGRYPPVHHSGPFRRTYAPHYRVVARRAWRREFGEELTPP